MNISEQNSNKYKLKKKGEKNINWSRQKRKNIWFQVNKIKI